MKNDVLSRPRDPRPGEIILDADGDNLGRGSAIDGPEAGSLLLVLTEIVQSDACVTEGASKVWGRDQSSGANPREDSPRAPHVERPRRAHATKKIARRKWATLQAWLNAIRRTRFIQGSYIGDELCPVLGPADLTITGTVNVFLADWFEKELAVWTERRTTL